MTVVANATRRATAAVVRSEAPELLGVTRGLSVGTPTAAEFSDVLGEGVHSRLELRCGVCVGETVGDEVVVKSVTTFVGKADSEGMSAPSLRTGPG